MTDETKYELESVEKRMVAAEKLVKAAETFTRAIDRACKVGVEVELFTAKNEEETDSVNFYVPGSRMVCVRTILSLETPETNYFAEDESEDE